MVKIFVSNIPYKTSLLSSWGQRRQLLSKHCRPESYHDITEAVVGNTSILARGSGLSYGDAAVAETVLCTERLQDITYFDAVEGVITVQAGMRMHDLLSFLVPRRWLVPVIPGAKDVTIGGCVASNVHGKNHAAQGAFDSCVVSMELMLANGEVIECSPTQQRDVFMASCGGMGMTGVIRSVTLSLVPISSGYVEVDRVRVSSLEELLQCFERDHSYQVAWIDHFAKGDVFGRGVYEGANLASGKAHYPTLRTTSLCAFVPWRVLWPVGMRAYNTYRWWSTRFRSKQCTMSMQSYFFPLDRLQGWNRLYGKKGLLQYQCIIPSSPELLSNLEHILRFLHDESCPSYLMVLKKHGDDRVLLPFSKKGYSLAMDFPNTPHVRHVLDKLDQKVLSMEGRVYLAKDMRLGKEAFEHMYKDTLVEWKRIVSTYDAQKRFRSCMSERLGFK